MSLRARLLAAVIVVVIVLGAVGVTVVSAQRRYLTDQLDQQLEGFARSPGALRALGLGADRGPGGLGGRGGPGGSPPVLAELYVGLLDGNRLTTVSTPTGDPALRLRLTSADAINGPKTVSTTAGRADRVRVVTVPLADGAVAVFASPTTSVENAITRLTWTVGIGALVVVAVLALVVWWVIRLGLRPIHHMTEAADAIAAGASDRRVDVPDDGTEAARLGRALNAMIDVNQASEARLRQFVADASHELRTPLTTLRGYSSLHAAGGLPDEVAVDDAMRRINAESLRMAHLVDELLLLADLDEGTPLDRAPVDLAAVVRDLATDMRVMQPDRTVEVDAPDSAIVIGDRDRLTQAVAALTTNALRHTPVGAPITIRVRSNQAVGRVEVVDGGPGIAPEDRERIFDRFFRTDTSRARSTGGNGLGLAILASIVDGHGGRYGVESEPAGGSTFWIEIPTGRHDG